MSQLTQADTKYWAPVPEVLKFLEGKYAGGRILDVGPGHCPLPWATDSVDFVDAPGAKNLVKCDLTNEPIPYPDKSFDLVFCRHLLEDSWNPFPICKEISRVGKAGYIETPSPIAELCRGVDGSSPPYRGYHHHRFLVWTFKNNTLSFVTKYPLIEYIDRKDDAQYVSILRQGPKYWNTYYLWENEINIRHLQSPLDFDVGQHYGQVVQLAAAQSMYSTDVFWSDWMNHASPVIASLPQRHAAT